MKQILFFLFLLLGMLSGSSTAHDHIRHHRTVDEDEASSCDSGLPQSDENTSMEISHDGSYGSVDGIQRVLDPVDVRIIRILVAHLETLRKGILKLEKEFKSNDIVKESMFLNLIYSLITTDIDIDGFFESGLVWPDKKQQQKKLFELLKKLIEMGIQLEENEKTRKSLQAALDASNDGLKKFQEYMEEPDIKKFLLDWVKERFQEGIKDGLKKWLEKKIGEKAAGMLFNSLKRLYDAISLSSTIERQDELAKEFNEILLFLLEILEGMEDPNWDFGMEYNQELKPYGRWVYPDFYKGYARIEPRFNYFIPGDEEQGTQDQWYAIKVPFHIINKDGELELKNEYEIEDLNKVDGTVIKDGKIIVPLPMIIVPGPGNIPQGVTHMFMELYIESRTEDNKNKNKPDEKARVIIGVKIPPKPITLKPTSTPTETPSDMPSAHPTDQPSTEYPTTEPPTTPSPSDQSSPFPTTDQPSPFPTTDQPSPFPSTVQPSTDPPSPFPSTVQSSPSIPPTTTPPSTGPPTNTPPPNTYAPNLIV